MVISILIILCLFSVSFTAIWIWYVRNEKNSPARFYKNGMKSFKKNDYQNAKTELLKTVSAEPNNKEAILALGLTYINLKDYDKAKENMEKFLKTSPKDFNALYNMGLILQKLEKNDEAKEYYLKAVQENPKSFAAYLNLGTIHLAQNDYVSAIDFLDRALEISPDNVEIQFNMLRCKDEICKYDNPEEGNAIIEEYLKLKNNKNLPKEFYKTLARAYAKNGRMEESIKLCQEALESDIEDIDSYKYLGLVQLINNDIESAKNSLVTAIHLKPDDEEAHDLLSYVLCQQKSKCAIRKCREQYKESIKKFLNK